MGKPKSTQTEIVYVRWFDSAITWGQPVSAEEAAGVMEMESVGMVVREDRKSITVALDRSLGTQNLRCTLCIPKVNVRSVKRFHVTSSLVE